MRNTLEIIIAVKESAPVTEEELRLALIVMTNVEHFVRRDLTQLIEAVEEGKPSAKMRATQAKGTLDRMFYARKKDPREWLGPADTPGTPEYEARYKAAMALLAKVEARAGQ